MEFHTYFDNKLNANLEDAFTKHLESMVQNTINKVVPTGGAVFNIATARKELDKMSMPKVSQTSFGMFQAPENKQNKPQAEISTHIQPKSKL